MPSFKVWSEYPIPTTLEAAQPVETRITAVEAELAAVATQIKEQEAKVCLYHAALKEATRNEAAHAALLQCASQKETALINSRVALTNKREVILNERGAAVKESAKADEPVDTPTRITSPISQHIPSVIIPDASDLKRILNTIEAKFVMRYETPPKGKGKPIGKKKSHRSTRMKEVVAAEDQAVCQLVEDDCHTANHADQSKECQSALST